MVAFNFRDVLAETTWEEGKTVSLVVGSYRHETVAVCSAAGRQRAQFANGEFPYFAHVELLGAGGKRIEQGAGIVPVLPDGRLLMVVEQRPPQGRVADRPHFIKRKSAPPVDLRKMGPHSSLEFPGGAVDPDDKNLKASFLRELRQETGVENQTAMLYRTLRPVFAFGSDISVKAYFGVAYLSGVRYQEYVKDDGGLYVLALTEGEVRHNIINGVIVSGQAFVLQWNFYKELMDSFRLGETGSLISDGYIVKEEVRLIKP